MSKSIAATLSALALATGADAATTPTVVATLMDSLAQGEQHPTLPFRWTAVVREDEVGWVDESYKMVYKPTPANPSGKWTNYTDGSCSRLILDPDLPLARRYLLLCDAVDCCYEEQSGNHIEYQVPNVHPAALSPVAFGGKKSITLDKPDGDQFSLEADLWTWKFGPETYYAYTTGSGDKGTLHQWIVNIEGQNFTNTYLNYTAPADVAAFDGQFHVPSQCDHDNVLKCGDLHKAGKLSDKSYKFLKAGN
jgi:hypothetical protein